MMRIKIILFAIIIALSSCKTLTPSIMFQTDSNFEYDSIATQNKEIRIAPYDQLDILMTTNGGQILLEQTFSQSTGNIFSKNQQDKITYMVDKDSLVKLPTIGRVKLGGMTILEAEEYLEKAFAENYQTPFVKIEITNRKVMLFFDESTRGHIVKLPEEDMTLIEAIAATGGMSNNSKSYKIKLIRKTTEGTKVYNYNFRNIKNFSDANISLSANDIVYIDSRPKYFSKLVSELQPYMVLLSTCVLVYKLF